MAVKKTLSATQFSHILSTWGKKKIVLKYSAEQQPIQSVKPEKPGILNEQHKDDGDKNH